MDIDYEQLYKDIDALKEKWSVLVKKYENNEIFNELRRISILKVIAKEETSRLHKVWENYI